MTRNISDIISAPHQYSTIFPTGCEEHALVISHRNAIHWMLVLVEGGDQPTLWTELLDLVYSTAEGNFILEFGGRVYLDLG
jgi:hypothetical protein